MGKHIYEVLKTKKYKLLNFILDWNIEYLLPLAFVDCLLYLSSQQVENVKPGTHSVKDSETCQEEIKCTLLDLRHTFTATIGSHKTDHIEYPLREAVHSYHRITQN